MPERKDEGEVPAVAVGHDGKIEGIYRPGDSRRNWSQNESARLELQARPRSSQAPAPPPAPRKKRSALVPVLVILAAALLPFGIPFALRAYKEYQLRDLKASGLIVADSIPSNARIFIDGVEVGRTPYVAPNTFQPGTEVPVKVIYPGALEWTGSFPGGVATTFTAELQSSLQ